MTVFDEATAVARRSEGIYDTAADPRFALIAPGGATPPAVNGGALLATVLRAVLDGSPHPYPVATNASFLRVPQLAPAEVQVSWLKLGRTAATARATFIQDGQPVLDTTVTTGTLPAAPAASAGGAAAGSSADGADHGEGAVGAGEEPRRAWSGLASGRRSLTWPTALISASGQAQPPPTDRLASPRTSKCCLTRPAPAGGATTRPGYRRCAATCACAITVIRMRSCWRSRWTRCRRWYSGSAPPAGRRPSS